MNNNSSQIRPASAYNRQSAIKALSESPLDLLVVGGGIVGAGVIRDAAMRGLRAAIVEQYDFASGTSSRSSRLLHGGLRYLAQGRVGLVHEASVEKKVVHHIAPHLAEPLPFIFPTYRGNKDWVLWQLKIGVKIYDLLCGGRNLGKSTWMNAGETLKAVPALASRNLNGAVRYYDGLTNDSRLTIDTLRSAAKAGAMVLNYCRFENGSRGELWNCELDDRLAGSKCSVQARAIVNATGPWADAVPHSRVHLRLTKGIHLVVERSRVPVPDTVVMTEGKRILFAIPWGERTILGTTDTDYHDRIEAVRADAADLRYVLEITNQFFPNAQLSEKDVISFWAGLRPLIADPNGKPSDISRSHQITNPEPFWWDVAGGKLTTYRLMAEQTVDKVIAGLRSAKVLGVEPGACRTATEPLLPFQETEGLSGILPPQISRKPVEHYVGKEWAIHLDDIMLRRTGWHYYYRNAPEIAQHVSEWMAELLGWPAQARAHELERYRVAVSRTPDPASAKTGSTVAV